MSQKQRKRVEETFGWARTIGGPRAPPVQGWNLPTGQISGCPSTQTVYRGLERVRTRFITTMVANNLARLPRLRAA